MRPERRLGARHAGALCIGMVVGAGIFKTSPMVAQSLPDAASLYLAWALGGVFSFVGALCFAELAAAFPDAGGDYHFLSRAYGRRLGFLFAWSRFAVIHTGSMALLGFVFGDYLAQAVDLGPWLGTHASALLAAALIVVLTALNLLGVRVGLGTQLGLTSLVLCGLLALGAVMAFYLLANWAYLRVLGLPGLAHSQAPAAEAMRLALGRGAELAMVGVVTLTALSVMNAILIAGPRTTYAAARDLAAEWRLAQWNARRGTPSAAVLATAAMALLLVALGDFTRGGFSTMVDYLSPVYWFFLVLSGAALIVLRRREPDLPRPFRVPLYPWLPLLFCGCSAWLLWASLVYVKAGALLGVAVLAAGGLLPLIKRR